MANPIDRAACPTIFRAAGRRVFARLFRLCRILELAVSMFAVIRTGGKQYKVAPNDLITVEKLGGDPGATIELGEVLMVGEGADVTTGAPLIAGASVSATLVEQRRGPKIIVFKKKRRQNYRRKNGHRQYETVLRITGITAGA
jgi:large subunit ribosomal protein L21